LMALSDLLQGCSNKSDQYSNDITRMLRKVDDTRL
jgi:hypothetical protein